MTDFLVGLGLGLIAGWEGSRLLLAIRRARSDQAKYINLAFRPNSRR